VGTPDLYPLENIIGDKSLSLLTIRPRFVGLAARPRAATLPHTSSEEACVSGKAGGSRAVQPGVLWHPPSVLAWSAVCAPLPEGSWCSTGGTGSAGGAGRSRTLKGALGGVVEHASNSPRRLRAIEHASDTRLGALPPTKAGGKRTGAQRSTRSLGWKHEVHPSPHHEEPASKLYSKHGVLTRHAAAAPAYRVDNAHKLARRAAPTSTSRRMDG